MALRTCKSCKHQVDSSAKTCPSCGVSKPGQPLGETILGLIILAVIIAVVLKFCSFGISNAHASAGEPPTPLLLAASSDESPEIAQSPDWKYIVNNAIRTADNYATSRDSRATFINNPSVELIKILAGALEGTYVVQLINKNSDGVSYAQLKPLFDMQSAADELDDEGKLWEVVLVKFNGVVI